MPDPLPLNLRNENRGTLIQVKACAGASQNRIGGVHDGALKVSVTQVAEKGKANKAIIDVLAKYLGISKSTIELKSGATHSIKTFLIKDKTISDVWRCIKKKAGIKPA